MSLPTPKIDTFKKLEQVFKNFIWKGKPPKIRNEILENSYQMGGLKMTNLQTFDQSLKSSWIKRIKEQTDGWEELPRKYQIDKIILFGNNYPTKILQNLEDPFWKNVVNACQLIQYKLYNDTLSAFNIPLWYNGDINISFRREWFKKGYTKLSDILDVEGVIYSRAEMSLRGLKINFLD